MALRELSSPEISEIFQAININLIKWANTFDKQPGQNRGPDIEDIRRREHVEEGGMGGGGEGSDLNIRGLSDW